MRCLMRAARRRHTRQLSASRDLFVPEVGGALVQSGTLKLLGPVGRNVRPQPKTTGPQTVGPTAQHVKVGERPPSYFYSGASLYDDRKGHVT